MTVRNFSMIFGAVLLIVGILGFVPAFLRPTLDITGLHVQAGAGYLLGLFPVNIIHSLVHVAAGVWGLIAMRNYMSAKRFAIAMAWVYGILTIMGFIPVLNTLFGFAPLYGNDIWLHALLAIAAGYFAYYAQDTEFTTARHV